MYVLDRDPKLWGELFYKYHKETYDENFHFYDFIPMWTAHLLSSPMGKIQSFLNEIPKMRGMDRMEPK